jgi:hypothetical protein
MPNYAYVQCDPSCPNCGTVQTDLIAFQWGYLPGYGPRAGRIYSAGDPVIWRACRDGTVPPWTFFYGGEDNDTCNAGDPAIADLYALDQQQTWLFEDCRFCGKPMGGGLVEIRKGILIRAWVQRADAGRVVAASGLVRIEPCSTLSELIEPEMQIRRGCGPLAFWSIRGHSHL